MAAILPDKIGTAFGADAATATLDGLVEITYDRIDRDYAVNENAAYLKRQRTITLRYQPPGNVANLDYYNAIGQILAVERVVGAGAGAGTKKYLPTIMEVFHRRYSNPYQDEYTIICGYPDGSGELKDMTGQ